MVLEFLQITVITTVILSGGGILCSDSKIINTYDLLVSMVNVSSTLICRSNSMNNPVIWERLDGCLIFSMSRVNQYETSRFDVDLSFMPDYVLTLLNPRFSDAGVWLCKPEQSEVYSKQLTHIVVESQPVCDIFASTEEINYNAVHATCTMKYAGKDLHFITWYFGSDNNLMIMNGSQLSVFKKTIDNVTTTRIISAISVIGRSLTSGSIFKCHIQFKLPNYSNTSKYSFNCTTRVYTRRLQIEKSVSKYDLLVSKVNTSSLFICYAYNNTTPIIWDVKSSGDLLYSIDKVNKLLYEPARFLMDSSSNPKYVLTWLDPQLIDGNEYCCKPQASDVLLKSLMFIVIESDPVGGVSLDEANTGHAWCSLTYGGQLTPTVTWHYTTMNNTIVLNGSSSSQSSSDLGTLTINSTINVTNLEFGSSLQCYIHFEMTNSTNASKYTFNWTSQSFSGRVHRNKTDELSNETDVIADKTDVIYSSMTTWYQSSKSSENETFTSPVISTYTIVGAIAMFIVIVVMIYVVIKLHIYFKRKITGREATSKVAQNEPMYSDVNKPNMILGGTNADLLREPFLEYPYEEIDKRSTYRPTERTTDVNSRAALGMGTYSEIDKLSTYQAGTSEINSRAAFNEGTYSEIDKLSTYHVNNSHDRSNAARNVPFYSEVKKPSKRSGNDKAGTLSGPNEPTYSQVNKPASTANSSKTTEPAYSQVNKSGNNSTKQRDQDSVTDAPVYTEVKKSTGNLDKQDNDAAGATVPVYAEVHKPTRNIAAVLLLPNEIQDAVISDPVYTEVHKPLCTSLNTYSEIQGQLVAESQESQNNDDEAKHYQPGHEYEDLSFAIQPKIDPLGLAETISEVDDGYASINT